MRGGVYLNAEAAGFPLFVDCALSAGPTEHIGTNFALALQLLHEKHRSGHFRNAFCFHALGGAVAFVGRCNRADGIQTRLTSIFCIWGIKHNVLFGVRECFHFALQAI